MKDSIGFPTTLPASHRRCIRVISLDSFLTSLEIPISNIVKAFLRLTEFLVSLAFVTRSFRIIENVSFFPRVTLASTRYFIT